MEGSSTAQLTVPLLWSVRRQAVHHTGGLLRLQLSEIVPNLMVPFRHYNSHIVGTKVVSRVLF